MNPKTNRSPGRAKPTREVRGIRKFLGASSVYALEYLLMLLSFGVGIGILCGQIFRIFMAFDGNNVYINSDSVAALTAIIVLMPIALILLARTQGSEIDKPELQNEGWRKFFLYSWIVIAMIAAVSMTINSLYHVISAVAIAGGRAADILYLSIPGAISAAILSWACLSLAKKAPSSLNLKSRRTVLLSFSVIIASIVVLGMGVSIAKRDSSNNSNPTGVTYSCDYNAYRSGICSYSEYINGRNAY